MSMKKNLHRRRDRDVFACSKSLADQRSFSGVSMKKNICHRISIGGGIGTYSHAHIPLKLISRPYLLKSLIQVTGGTTAIRGGTATGNELTR